jgi:hypothetical protein
MAKKNGEGSRRRGEDPGRRKPASKKKAAGERPKPTPKPRATAKSKPRTAPMPEDPAKDDGKLHFERLTSHRPGTRKVPVAISLREAQDAADRAMEIAALLRSAEGNLAMVKERQKEVVANAQGQIGKIRQRFDEEADKWEQRRAPKTRSGIWAFDLEAKDEDHPHGKKYFACPDMNLVFGPDPVTRDDLEGIKQQAIVPPSTLKKTATMPLAMDLAPEGDTIITPDMLGFTSAERPQIGNCQKCDAALYPQDGHYTYKNLLFCVNDSQCAKCNRVVLLDKDEFHRVVAGKENRVCAECAEELDATGAGTHVPRANRKQMRDVQTTLAPPPQTADQPPPDAKPGTDTDAIDDVDDEPAPRTAVVPHLFVAGPAPEFCGVDFCGRQQTDPIHEVEDDDEEEMP